MSTARPSRNRRVTRARQTGSAEVYASAEVSTPESVNSSGLPAFAEVIRAERRRLMKANAVLGCVAFALLYDDWLEGPDRPSFVDALAAIQDLVAQVVERLDCG